MWLLDWLQNMFDNIINNKNKESWMIIDFQWKKIETINENAIKRWLGWIIDNKNIYLMAEYWPKAPINEKQFQRIVEILWNCFWYNKNWLNLEDQELKWFLIPYKYLFTNGKKAFINNINVIFIKTTTDNYYNDFFNEKHIVNNIIKIFQWKKDIEHVTIVPNIIYFFIEGIFYDNSHIKKEKYVEYIKELLSYGMSYSLPIYYNLNTLLKEGSYLYDETLIIEKVKKYIQDNPQKDSYFLNFYLLNKKEKTNNIFSIKKKEYNLLTIKNYIIKEIWYWDVSLSFNIELENIEYKKILVSYIELINNNNKNFFYNNDPLYNILMKSDIQKIKNIIQWKVQTSYKNVLNEIKGIIQNNISIFKNNIGVNNVDDIINNLNIIYIVLYSWNINLVKNIYENKDILKNNFNISLSDIDNFFIKGLWIAIKYGNNIEVIKYIVENIILKKNRKEELLNMKFWTEEYNILQFIIKEIKDNNYFQELFKYFFTLFSDVILNKKIKSINIIKLLINNKKEEQIILILEYLKKKWKEEELVYILNNNMVFDKLKNTLLFVSLENNLTLLVNYILDNLIEYINKERINENWNNAFLLSIKLWNLDLIDKIIQKGFWYNFTNKYNENVWTMIVSYWKNNEIRKKMINYFMKIAEKDDNMFNFLVNTLWVQNVGLMISIIIKTDNYELLQWILKQKIKWKEISEYINKGNKQGLVLIAKRLEKKDLPNNKKIQTLLQTLWKKDMEIKNSIL